MTKFMQQFRRSLLARGATGITDGELLTCFIERRDESAFTAIVQRHGPMVWGVCRRLLRNHHDAEDAFQASFLVLARKAASVNPRELVANWLYGVACTTAHRLKVTIAKRRLKEKQVTEIPDAGMFQQDICHDLRPLLDRELSRLPDKYRILIVLCDLHGRTRKDAARQLGVPEGTVAGRLARARVMLAKRLVRYRLAISGSVLAGAMSNDVASGAMPASVLSNTIKAASLFTARRAPKACVSVKVAALTEGVLKTMLLTKLKAVTAATILVLAFVVCGGRLLSQPRAATQPKHTENGGTTPVTNAEFAPKVNASEASKKPKPYTQVYKALFGKTLEVLAEYFEVVVYANQYDGRIEVSGTDKASRTFSRRGFVEIRATDSGDFAIAVRVENGKQDGDEWQPVGRDRDLESLVQIRLNELLDKRSNKEALRDAEIQNLKKNLAALEEKVKELEKRPTDSK